MHFSLARACVCIFLFIYFFIFLNCIIAVMTVCSEATGERGSARLTRCVGVLLFFLPAVSH